MSHDLELEQTIEYLKNVLAKKQWEKLLFSQLVHVRMLQRVYDC